MSSPTYQAVRLLSIGYLKREKSIPDSKEVLSYSQLDERLLNRSQVYGLCEYISSIFKINIIEPTDIEGINLKRLMDAIFYQIEIAPM